MRRSSITMLIALIAIIAVLGGAAYYVKNQGGSGGIVKDKGDNISDYSAVFLTNGQVYFGKIDEDTDKSVGLTDIFYLQVANQTVQPDTSKTENSNENPDISLVKLGNELHGPNDRMHINRQQVLFTESLKNDSKVVSAIKDYKNK